MSAMLYWSAASHSRSFKRSLSTCAHLSVINAEQLLVKGLQCGPHFSQQNGISASSAKNLSARGGGWVAHLVQPVGLIDVSVLGVLDLLWRIPHKVVGLRITDVSQVSHVQLPQPVKDIHRDPVGPPGGPPPGCGDLMKAAIGASQLLDTPCWLSGLIKRGRFVALPGHQEALPFMVTEPAGQA